MNHCVEEEKIGSFGFTPVAEVIGGLLYLNFYFIIDGEAADNGMC